MAAQADLDLQVPGISKPLSHTTSEGKVDVHELPGRNPLSELPEVPRDEELHLLRKFDSLLLPPLALLFVCLISLDRMLNETSSYLMNSLDKGNVGNAKTDGWDKVFIL
jgi:hypothetical protein